MMRIAPGNPRIAHDLRPQISDLQEIHESRPGILNEMLAYCWYVSRAPFEEMQALAREVAREAEEDFMPIAEVVAARSAVKTRVQDVLAVLDVRKIAVSDADRGRIEGCTDVATLDAWIRLAAVVPDTASMFAAPE